MPRVRPQICTRLELSKDVTPDELMLVLSSYCDKMLATARAKNADYTGAASDAFANFAMIENLGVVSTEAGMFVRFTDKFMRVASFIKKGVLAVKDETVEDTLLDLANYCLLMAAYISTKKAKEPSLVVRAAVASRASGVADEF